MRYCNFNPKNSLDTLLLGSWRAIGLWWEIHWEGDKGHDHSLCLVSTPIFVIVISPTKNWKDKKY